MTSISECAYVHADDIDPERHVDSDALDTAMQAAVGCALESLQEPIAGYTEFQRQTLRTVYLSMQSTHRLIRRVLRTGWQNPESIDALALARLPLEGLYTLCLMLEEASWVDVYLKDGWQKQHASFLLECAETQNLPRFHDFCNRTGPATLNLERQLLGITDAEVATIKHIELNDPMPEGMQTQPISWFPTPKRIIDRLQEGTDKRKMLERLHREYGFLSTFAHGLPGALLFKMMFDETAPFPDMGTDEQLRDIFQRQVAGPAYTISLISLIQGAAELLPLYPANVELATTVNVAWETPKTHFLLARAIWNLRTKNLPGVDNTA